MPEPEAVCSNNADCRLKNLRSRIKQLGDKATQLLTFLSFALVVAAILETQGQKLGPCQTTLMTFAMRCWAGAIFPILIGILPVKEINEDSVKWYNFVRWAKFALLWVAIIAISVGAGFFVCAIWRLGMIQD